MRQQAFVVLLTIVCLGGKCRGQSAQATSEALFHTFMIATNFGRGTTFSIDVDNREYWITAKHMFTGIKSGPAGVFNAKTVQATILSQTGEGDEGHDQHWTTETFTVIDPGKNIDILVLVPDHLLLQYQRGSSLNFESPSVGLGGTASSWVSPMGAAGRPSLRMIQRTRTRSIGFGCPT